MCCDFLRATTETEPRLRLCVEANCGGKQKVVRRDKSEDEADSRGGRGLQRVSVPYINTVVGLTPLFRKTQEGEIS